MRTAPWTHEQIMTAAKRGCHKSARDHTEFVCEELVDFCRQGYWTVLPLDAVQHWPELRLSPLGVVPQRERRPRLIVDYTFSGVNQDTARLGPAEAMQFGRALQRVLTQIVHADPRFGPPKLAKIDIADGFYRVWLWWRDIPKLGVLLPFSGNGGSTQLVAFPSALPMGWVESPPHFTTLTETACDLANAAMTHGGPMRAHRLEQAANTPPSANEDNTHATRPATIWKRSTPLGDADPSHRKEPSSVKKMLQGDAHWDTRKMILGWQLDTVAGTLNLPPHRIACLYELLDAVQPPRKRLPLKAWHKLLGELRSMAPGLPGSGGLFSVLQDALSRGDRGRIRLNRHVFDTMADFRLLADSLAHRPTRLRELVPVSPSDSGSCDACRRGMGGVCFDLLQPDAPPIVWRAPFPASVQSSLITADHPHGTLSISDLELVGTIAHKDVLAQARHVHERTIWIAGDNKASLSWATKGSATSDRARAYLLRLNALHQRAHRYVSRHHYIAGTANSMADDASRLWHLSDSDLLTHFDSAYPQCTSWTLHHPTPTMLSALNGALSKQRCVPECLLSEIAQLEPPGNCGRPFAWKKADPPPTRVKPLPLQVVHGASQLALLSGTPLALAAADCMVVAFYFLLRPGEYAGAPKTDADDLFRLQDLGLWIGGRKLDVPTCPLADLTAATFATLTFTSQKNGVRGETVGHGRSGHPTLCPVLRLASRALHLRQHNALPTTPLNASRTSPTSCWQYVPPSCITALLRSAVALSPGLGFSAKDVSARSTRSGGAMALLCAGIDGDRIRLIGRWRSDEMYRYLHVQAQPVMNGIAAAMFRGGTFSFTPGDAPTLPAAALLAGAPPF
ncbi:hypothetical protein MHU86_21301 [Fragilaria crotonensis]|nr:hypothetical protein MHU86_21301 [Fragilaria crotonensis]